MLDATGAPVSGVQVKFTRGAILPVLATSTSQDGEFSFTNVAPGPFELSVAVAGFKTKTVSAVLPANENYLAPAITLELASVVTDVTVKLTTEEVSAEQIKMQEQQKLLAVIPNYYATYVADAAPMRPKQKFGLAWKLAIDPVTFDCRDHCRRGAANTQWPATDRVRQVMGIVSARVRRLLYRHVHQQCDSAVDSETGPTLFLQRHGHGEVADYVALAMSVVTKGDNGHWQPNYSGLLGSLATGGISNLYYPGGSRNGFETTLNNTLIGIGTSAGVNILQEFVFRKVTPKKPPVDPPTT